MPTRTGFPTKIVAGAVAAVLTLGFSPTSRADGEKGKRADIYDTKADGAKQIADALTIAKRDNKRVLLQFGANWCSWCHLMHETLENEKQLAKVLQYEYVFVLVDVDEVDGKQHNASINEKYGEPIKNGLPAWVVLDADGKQIATVNTEPFELGKGYDSDKILAALNKYKPEPVSAESVMSSAIAEAKAKSKNVFVQFSAPWCSWCKKFDAYFADESIASVFEGAYVRVKVDIERMANGEDVAERYGKDEDQGIPFFAVVDGQGKKLIDSVGPKGNCGYPVEDFEVAHYMNVLEKTANLPPDKLAVLKKGLALGK